MENLVKTEQNQCPDKVKCVDIKVSTEFPDNKTAVIDRNLDIFATDNFWFGKVWPNNNENRYMWSPTHNVETIQNTIT